MDNHSAQQRADRIHAFREELQALQQEGVLSLPPETQGKVAAYHEALLRELNAQFDVDTSHQQKRLSWGMRIASFLGALAISAAVFFFLLRFWGLLDTPLQVVLLVAAPLVMTLAVEGVARRERGGLISPPSRRWWRSPASFWISACWGISSTSRRARTHF